VSLETEKTRVLEEIQSLDQVIRGSVFEYKRYCGKPSCNCKKTQRPHRSMFLSFKYQGKTRLIPITEEQIPQIKQRINDYKQLKAAIDELARINAELLRSEP